MNSLTKMLIAAFLVLATSTLFQIQRIHDQREQLHKLARKSGEYEVDNRRLREERDRSFAAITTAQNAIDAMQQVGEYAITNSELGAWLGRVNRLKQWLQAAPEKGIPEMQFLSSNDWLSVTLDNPLDSDAKIRDALSKLRYIAKTKPQVGPNLMQALRAYSKTHVQPPSDPTELRPYLNPPLSDEILQRYQPVPEIAGENDANGAIRDGVRIMVSGRIALQEKAPVDEDYDTWIVYTEKGGSTMGGVSQLGKMVNQAMRALNKANNGQDASTPELLLPYLPASVEQTRLKEYWDTSKH
jgi:hypothetical protein